MDQEASTTTSLSEVVGGTRQHDLPGEDLLRSETEPVVSEQPATKSETKAAKPKSGEQDKGATPAQAKAEDKADNDDGLDDDSDPHPVPRKALIAERKKRQEYERKLAQLEGQLSAFQQFAQQGPRPPVQETKPTDPADEFYSGPVDFISKREQALKQEFEQKFLAMNVAQVQAQFQDYGEAEAAFVEAAKYNPTLQAQLRQSANPALFAYQNGKAFMELKDIGSLDELRERIRQEERERLESEYRKQNVITQAAQASTSSAGAKGAGANTSPVFSGPTPLNQIFGRRI
jgi:hypothetical protein